MRLRVLGCSGGSAPGRELSCYLVDDVVAIDAGALTTALPLEGQRALRAVLLTHGHLDHVWTLPFFLLHRYDPDVPSVVVHASRHTIETLHVHLFNARIWVDLDAMVVEGRPLALWEPIEPGGSAIVAERYEVAAVGLTHTVPSQAYCVRRDGAAVIVCGDTTATDDLWTYASSLDDLRGILVECSWPDSDPELATASGHLTPHLLGAELAKLRSDAPVYVTHVKPGREAEVLRGLAALGDDRLRLLSQGDVIDFR